MNDFIEYLLGGYSLFTSEHSLWIIIVDLLLVYFLLYRGLLLLKGTKAVSMFLGLLLLLVVYFSAQFFGFQTFSWLLSGFFNSFIIVVLILFQDDLRRALAQFGINPFSGRNKLSEQELMGFDEIKRAVDELCNSRTGALIIIERNADVLQHVQDGVELDAKISHELLFSIFLPRSPIHDGAVLIRKERISHAGCFLPLTRKTDVDKTLGTRHRAGLGISELTDAFVIIVSETKGAISVCLDGVIERNLDKAALFNKILETLKQ